jgi:hypothetical protein
MYKIHAFCMISMLLRWLTKTGTGHILLYVYKLYYRTCIYICKRKRVYFLEAYMYKRFKFIAFNTFYE